MSTTIKDVARLAKCSIKTVSRVLNNEPHVSETVRVNVLSAIKSSGYSPNLSARRLVQKRSNTICILVYPGFMQPSSAWLTHLLDLMFEEDYDLMLQTYYPSFPLSRRKLAELATGRRFDGCISTPPCEADGFIVDLFATYKIPLVQINPLSITPTMETNQHFVIADDKKGASLAVSHLINLGHRKIAFLRGPRNMRAAFDRFSGFCETMTNAGLSINDHYQMDTEFTFDGGYTAAKMVMQYSDPPTAIYAANDEVAQGVLFAAQELGLDIPGDLSICGHDNLLSSARTWPGITTIHQPIDELLENALHLLISILKKEDTNISPIVLTPRIIVRGSTAPYKQRN